MNDDEVELFDDEDKEIVQVEVSINSVCPKRTTKRMWDHNGAPCVATVMPVAVRNQVAHALTPPSERSVFGDVTGLFKTGEVPKE